LHPCNQTPGLQYDRAQLDMSHLTQPWPEAALKPWSMPSL
jgi:hypothetical protein